MDIAELYYNKILSLFVETYRNEIATAQPGHCMKVTGFSLNRLQELLKLIQEIQTDAQTYILSETDFGDDYVSPSKLIELRNDLSIPLLVLIPINSRTSAEDSYGNATFKELSVRHLDDSLFRQLLSSLPDEIKSIVNEIFDYFKDSISLSEKINYLLFLEANDYKTVAVGKGIYLLRLIPDSILADNTDVLRKRLSYNAQNIELISDFSKSISERIAELKLEQNTIQQEIANFLQSESKAIDQSDVCIHIFEQYPELDFANWLIPEMQKRDELQLHVLSIKGKKLVDSEDGGKTLTIPAGKIERLKIRISTNPIPKDFKELKYFRIVVMAVDGMYKVCDLKSKIKVTDNKRAYRDVSFDVPDNLFEEGSYFFRVFAEDEYGDVLNNNDPFKEESIQQEWERMKAEIPELSKEEFQQTNRVLLTCDSDTFYLQVSEEDDIPEVETRKSKIDNVLQAYFYYRIEQNRKGLTLDIPTVKDNSGRWIDSSQLVNIYHIKYNASHNYQIILSRKLLFIERAFLDNCEEFGQVRATISANPTDSMLQSLRFEALDSALNIPETLVEKRKELFEQIKASANDDSGVVATFDFHNHIDLIKEYILEFKQWLDELANVTLNEELSINIQNLDMVSMNVEMPDGSFQVMKLISPLHPLRLSWMVNLFELYTDWEQKTAEYPEYQKSWLKKIDKFYYGALTPDVSPLILTEKSMNYFHYSGELSFGWGVYMPVPKGKERGFATNARQLKAYLSSLLNLALNRRIDSDVNQQMVLRHIKNYIKQHPYTDKLILNLFNAGDAQVFTKTLIELEHDFPELKYELRLFSDNTALQPGEALRNLLNPENQISEEAEAFSQTAENRLFPKLRFSINDEEDFARKPSDFQAHISFIVNMFSAETALIRQDDSKQSFYLNATIGKSVSQPIMNEKSNQWNRFFSTKQHNNSISDFSNESIELYACYQSIIAQSLSATREQSIPAIRLELNSGDLVQISHIHDVSDWVVTFDKNIGPELYDLPVTGSNLPYLLDYIPEQDIMGVASYLTTRPTSEVEGLMLPHFKNFGINIQEEDKFKGLLEDVRSVSSSLLMQFNTSQNKAFEVLGTTLMKRMLQKKNLLVNSFFIPIDLHKELFAGLEMENKERADNLLIDIHCETREIVLTVIEIKCRKTLSSSEKDDLQIKMMSQIENTISALAHHFNKDYTNLYRDRLDREVKTMELQMLLSFYLQRAYRYDTISPDAFKLYTEFLEGLFDDDFSINFKKLGIIFDFSAPFRQRKEFIHDTTFYVMGQDSISEILDSSSTLKTKSSEIIKEDNEFSQFFEKVNTMTSDVYKKQKDEVVSVEEVPNETDVADEEQFDDDKSYGQEFVQEPTQDELEVNKEIESDEKTEEFQSPEYQILIGKTSPSLQYGILGKTIIGDRKIAIDLNETNTISLFGVQGGGKSYTIGTITEMVLKQISNINHLETPLAGVIFHYSESPDYAPEFTSMIFPNDEEGQLKKLREQYGAEATSIDDVILLTPKDKVELRKKEYPDIEVLPICFHSSELNVQDWMFLLGAIGNDSTYIKQLKAIMKKVRKNISLRNVRMGVSSTPLLSTNQKALAEQRLQFAEEYINDDYKLSDTLKPGRLIIVDLRDEFIEEDEALGLFVVMLNIFSSVEKFEDKSFNKFIVFDEAHKYMNNKDLTGSIVTAIREMRHKGVSIMIASQDPMSLPTEIIELSSVMLLHKFNSPQWVKHVQKSIIQLNSLSSIEMASLVPGEAYLWATKSTDKSIMNRPIKISTRPRVTKHGGDTKTAIK